MTPRMAEAMHWGRRALPRAVLRRSPRVLGNGLRWPGPHPHSCMRTVGGCGGCCAESNLSLPAPATGSHLGARGAELQATAAPARHGSSSTRTALRTQPCTPADSGGTGTNALLARTTGGDWCTHMGWCDLP